MATDEATYLDEELIKSFMGLISGHLSQVEGNTVYVEIDELCDAFGIKLKGDWEQENWRLGHTIEKLNRKNLGIKALEVISGLDPINTTSAPVNHIKNCNPDIRGISFEVDFKKFGKRKIINAIKNKNVEATNRVEKITIIAMNNGKYSVAVNGNYMKIKSIRESKWWTIFIEEIEKRDVLNRTDNKKVPDEMVDYFNSNTKKCLIYMNGEYKPTQIFVNGEDDREINYDVKTELIDEKEYSKRKRKQDSR